MVISLRNIFPVCILYFSIISLSQASAQLLVFTDSAEVEYGRPVRVEIVGIALKEKISAINLNDLDKNFGIIHDYSVNNAHDGRWPNQVVQMLKLKLYPRHSGIISIPPLSIGNVISEEKKLNIISGETLLRGITLTSESPYEREQVVVKIKVETNNSNARLNVKNSVATTGFDVTPLEFKRSKLSSNKYLLEIGLSVTPLVSGNQELKLPSIEYSINAVSRKLFYLHPINMNIRKLPVYLSPAIPIGQVSIKSNLPAAGILATGSLYYWTIHITANTSHAYQLPAVLQQIKSNSDIEIFPAESKRQTNINHDVISSEATHIIPFKILSNGWSKLPQLQLQYFAPDTGKIRNITYEIPGVYALSFFWKVVIVIFLIIIITLSLSKFNMQLNQYKRSRKKLAQAKILLYKPKSKTMISDSMRLIAEAENWPKNIPLMQWQKFWSEKYVTNTDFEKLIPELSALFYGNNKDGEVYQISNKLLSMIENKKRIQKFKLF